MVQCIYQLFFFTSQHSQYQSFQWQWIKEVLQKKNSFVSDVWDSLLVIRLYDISELLLLSVIQMPHRKKEKNMYCSPWPALVLDLFFLGIYKRQGWKTGPYTKSKIGIQFSVVSLDLFSGLLLWWQSSSCENISNDSGNVSVHLVEQEKNIITFSDVSTNNFMFIFITVQLQMARWDSICSLSIYFWISQLL